MIKFQIYVTSCLLKLHVITGIKVLLSKYDTVDQYHDYCNQNFKKKYNCTILTYFVKVYANSDTIYY